MLGGALAVERELEYDLRAVSPRSRRRESASVSIRFHRSFDRFGFLIRVGMTAFAVGATILGVFVLAAPTPAFAMPGPAPLPGGPFLQGESAAEETPLERFRRQLGSENEADWGLALGWLDINWNQRTPDFPLRQYQAALVDILGAPDSRRRTQMILRNPTVESDEFGHWVIQQALEFEQPSFVVEAVTERLAELTARDRDRRDAWVPELFANSPLVFERLFDVLWRVDPGLTLGRTFRWLEEGGAESSPFTGAVIRRLGEALRIPFVDRDAALTWWKDNRERPIVEILTDDLRREFIEQWRRAATTLRSARESSVYRDWLLESLDTREVRDNAIARLQEFARSPNGAPERRKELLGPVLKRFLELLDESSDVNEQLRILDGIGDLPGFGDDERVRERFEKFLAPFRQPGAPYEKSDERYLLALRVVTVTERLATPIRDALDEVLALAIRKEGENWPVEHDQLIGGVLRALARTGPSERTVDLVEQIFTAPPREGVVRNGGEEEGAPLDKLRETAIRVLEKGAAEFSDEKKAKVLEIFRAALAQRDVKNVRRIAIVGLGNLGMPEGIPDLEQVVEESATVGGEDKTYAIGSIRWVGGEAAARSLRGLRTRLADAPEELVKEVRDAALDLCRGADPSFALLSTYVLGTDEEPPAPWLEETVADEAIAAKLSTSELTPDFATADPEGFARWLEIRDAVCARLEAVADEAKEVEPAVVAYRALEESAREVLIFTEEAESAAEPRERFAARANKAGRRQIILSGLTSGDFSKVSSALKEVAGSPPAMILSVVEWLLARALTVPSRAEEKEFLTSITRFCEEHAVELSAAGLAVFRQLEEREPGGGEPKTPKTTTPNTNSSESGTAEPDRP